jgi:hypothetical protein
MTCHQQIGFEMNQKTAKRLRKVATGMCVAAEQQGKTIQRVAYNWDRAGTMTVAKNTWKGVYKALKKDASGQYA